MIYAVDESNLRRQELLAEVFRPFTTELLRDFSVPEGADVLDVGCGIGQTTRLLKDMLPSPDRGSALTRTPTSWRSPEPEAKPARLAWPTGKEMRRV